MPSSSWKKKIRDSRWVACCGSSVLRRVLFLHCAADPLDLPSFPTRRSSDLSLWLALHDDLADPKSDDPIARESTRLSCAAVSALKPRPTPKSCGSGCP